MDIDLEDALKLADRNHQLCLKKKKEKYRQSRLDHQYLELFSSQSTLSSSSSPSEINYSPVFPPSIDAATPDANTDADTPDANADTDADISDTESDVIYYDVNEYTQTIDETSLSESLHLNEESENDNLVSSDQLLHPYTDSFCYHLVRVFREAGLSTTEHRKFLDLIHSTLPIPNNLPTNMDKLLSILEMKQNLFKTRKICIFCYHDIPDDICFCPNCPTSNEKDIVVIYDSDIKFILASLIETLLVEIHSYKEQIQTGNDTFGTKDIGFGSACQQLLNQFSNKTFVTALMHLDGVGLCKSNKLKLWLFSFSIVELPAKIRYQKFNMPVVSIWISSKEPDACAWLRNSVTALENPKVLDSQ